MWCKLSVTTIRHIIHTYIFLYRSDGPHCFVNMNNLIPYLNFYFPTSSRPLDFSTSSLTAVQVALLPVGHASKAVKKTTDMAMSCTALMPVRALVALRRKTLEINKDIWSNWTFVSQYRTKTGVIHKHRNSPPETVHKGKIISRKTCKDSRTRFYFSDRVICVQVVLIFSESFLNLRTSCTPRCPNPWVCPICPSTSSTAAAMGRSRLEPLWDTCFDIAVIIRLSLKSYYDITILQLVRGNHYNLSVSN